MEPGPRRRGPRRNRVDERQALPVALAGGAVALTSNAEPTGVQAVDLVLLFAGVAVVTWASASASWWVVTAAAGVAAAIALDPVVTIVGAVAFLIGMWIGIKRRDLSTARAAVAAVALNVLLRSELEVFLGLSAIIGMTVAAALFVLGIRRRNRTIRRRAWIGVGVVGVAAVLAVLGFAQGAASARSELTSGTQLARDGIAALDDGDFQSAARRFRDAAAAFQSADEALGRPWAVPARAIPVVAQNRDATVDLAATASSASTVLADALAAVDPDRLRLIEGRVDLAAIEAIERPLQRVEETLAELREAIERTDSPWLLELVTERVDELDSDIDDNEDSLHNAALAAELVPEMLGGDGMRRYFVAFTTPAEARGLGGFMGNYAVITANGGRLRMTEFGRTTDLNLATDPEPPREVTGPEDWLERYGEYGFTNGPFGGTGSVPWSNVTISPHFPSTAQVIAELYPQSGGRPVDGVFAMDPYVLAAFLEFIGPIQVEGTDDELTSDNLVQFLLEDQYLIPSGTERVDLLEEVSETTIDAILAGALPDPTDLADDLGPLAGQGRLVGWSANPDEQELFGRVSMDGALPALDGGDGVAITATNAGASKIDAYLGRTLWYEATVDEDSGEVEGTVTVELLNDTPPLTSPDVVVGNAVGDPRGTNRTLLTVYTALPVTSAMLDGEEISFSPGEEAGWRTATVTVRVPPNGGSTLTLAVRGTLELGDDGYSLSTRPQPLVRPEHHVLVVRERSGATLVNVDATADRPQRLTTPMT